MEALLGMTDNAGEQQLRDVITALGVAESSRPVRLIRAGCRNFDAESRLEALRRAAETGDANATDDPADTCRRAPCLEQGCVARGFRKRTPPAGKERPQ